MNIGILVMFVNSFGKRGFYNSQEIGMAKEFAKRGHKVRIYRCVNRKTERSNDRIKNNIEYETIPVKAIGNNAISNFEWIDPQLELLVCFSDVQILTRRVYAWSLRNRVQLIPYIGIAHSQSAFKLKSFVIDLLANGAYSVYKKTGAVVKTKAVAEELIARGVTDVDVAPVGLDTELLTEDYSNRKGELRAELKLNPDFKYLLMVGRIEEERNPLDVFDLFRLVHKEDFRYRLVIIGDGSLKEELQQRLESSKLDTKVTWIGQIPNSEMWKYYVACDCLVSFSRVEIFGMSILEAMYYELPVFVIHAPGPDDIIVNGETGFLFNNTSEMADAICSKDLAGIGSNEHKRVTENFTWKKTVDQIEKRLSRNSMGGSSRNALI